MPGPLEEYSQTTIFLAHIAIRTDESHHHDFGRHPESERHYAAAQSTRYNQIALFADVAINIFVAVARRDDRGPTEQSHLPAVGMTAQHQRNPLGYADHDIGLVCEENDGGGVGHLGQCPREIIDANSAHGPETMRRKIRKLVAETCQPEGLFALGQS